MGLPIYRFVDLAVFAGACKAQNGTIYVRPINAAGSFEVRLVGPCVADTVKVVHELVATIRFWVVETKRA